MDKFELVSIYKVPDERTGISLCDLLKQEGIEAILKSAQVPMYDSIMVMGVGYWGDIIVQKKDAPRAGEIIQKFFEGKRAYE